MLSERIPHIIHLFNEGSILLTSLNVAYQLAAMSVLPSGCVLTGRSG